MQGGTYIKYPDGTKVRIGGTEPRPARVAPTPKPPAPPEGGHTNPPDEPSTPKPKAAGTRRVTAEKE